MKNILEYIVDNYDINWKEHADAPVPGFCEDKINVFEFNHDSEEPLRDKDSNIYVQDNYIMLYWLCQEEWDNDLSGMENEMIRWTKYWIEQYKKTSPINQPVIIKVKVEDRDGYKYDTFTINIPN